MIIMIISKYVRDPNMLKEMDNLSQYFQVEQSVLTNCEIFVWRENKHLV